MIIHQNRLRQICKSLFAIVIIIFILCLGIKCENIFAKGIDDENLFVDYSKFNIEKTKQAADDFFKRAQDAQDETKKEEFLKNAAAQYYILSNAETGNSYACIQLARVYDLQKNDKYAKAYFSRALNLNYKDIDANFYFGEFYFKRNNYKKALEYYQKSLLYGKEGDASIYKNIGQIYEKFGDSRRSEYYYKESIRLNPNNNALKEKTKIDLKGNNQNSEYYQRR